MERQTKTIEVFTTQDGKEFMTVAEAEAHEAAITALTKRMRGLKYYQVAYAFDGTEGRGYYSILHVAVDDYPHVQAGKASLLQACFVLFGQPVSGWYGDGIYSTWLVHDSDEATFKNWRNRVGSVGSSRGNSSALFISNGPAIEGFPKPIGERTLLSEPKSVVETYLLKSK